MQFMSYNGRTFNSIELQFYEKRMGFCAKEYAMCVESDGQTYIVLGADTLERCKARAKRFVKRYKVNVSIRYFERESEDKFINELICTIDPSQCRSNKHKQKEIPRSTFEDENELDDIYKRYTDLVLNKK